MFWWKKTEVSTSFEIRRNWKKTIFKRSATIAIAALLLLPVPLLTKVEFFKTAFAAGQPTVSSVTPNNGPSAGGTSVTVTGTNFEAITGLTQISSNSNSNCAISAAKQAYCWGWNSDGQLGDGTQIKRSTPTPVDTSGVLSGKKISQISTDTHTCALTTDNGIYCWGDNAQGQLGGALPYNTRSLVPVAVDMSGVLSGKTITKVVVSGSNTCALDSTGKVYCWGWNLYGQLGDNTTDRSNVPVAVNTSGVLSGKVISQIAPSLNSTCVLATDGKAYCWGLGTSGQLGNNSTGNSSIPVAVTATGVLNGKTINALATGNGHSCVTTTSNNIYCWGINTNGMIGDNSTTNRLVPTAVVASGVLSGKTLGKMGLGQDVSCVTDTAGKAYCWGRNVNGNLGNNSTTQSTVPVAVVANGALNGKSISEIDAGNFHTCALTTDNATYCWGDNAYGQLGDDNGAVDSSVPVAAINLPLSQPTVSFGGADATNTTVVNSTTITATTPSHLAGSVDVAVISLDNQQGTLTNGYTYNNPAPTVTSISPSSGSTAGNTDVTVMGSNFIKGDTVTSIASGAYHSCAVTSKGEAYCWGKNTSGQLGDSTTTDRTKPVKVTMSGVLTGKTISQISTGDESTCALTTENKAYCWGGNSFGQLGDGTTTPHSSPVAVDASGVLAGKAVTKISLGFTHTCALTSEEVAYCWGDNTQGQLGDGTTTQRSSPVAVDVSGALAGKAVTKISLGYQLTCVTATEAYCWGGNAAGQLGNGTTSTSATSSPVAVNNSAAAVSDISAGYFHACAVYTSDSTAHCWGQNDYGQLGDGTINQKTTPVAVNASGVLAGKNITQVSSDGGHTCAIDAEGIAYCWGSDSNGELGNGAADANGGLPVIVDTSGELNGGAITQISVRFAHSCVTTLSGGAYCWGGGFAGQLGNNSTTNHESPVAVDTSDMLSNSTSLTVDGQVARNIVVVNSSSITASTPPHAEGIVDIQVINPDTQSATLSNSFTYNVSATAPQPPTNLTATPGASSVDLAWDAPIDDGGSAITNYKIEYSNDNGVNWNIFSHAASTATTIEVTGLNGGINYSFRVSAINAIGTSSPSVAIGSSPSYVSVTTSGSVSMSVTSTGSSRSSNDSHTVTIGTNNTTGYVLTLETIGAGRTLVNGAYSIPPVPGSVGSPTNGLQTDSWGFRVDGIGGFGSGTTSESNVAASAFNWAGVPANGSGDTIRSSTDAVTDDAFSVWYGMSADSTKPSGNYSNTVLYTAVAN